MAAAHNKTLRDILNDESGKRGVTLYVPANARAYACSHDGCERRAYAGRLCNAHYIRQRNGVDMNKPIRDRNANATCSECARLIGSQGGWGRCAQHFKLYRRTLIKSFYVERLGGCCSRCSGQFPQAVYDFHHVGSKDASISYLLSNASVEVIEAEMEKCILLCANCHRIEHHEGEL